MNMSPIPLRAQCLEKSVERLEAMKMKAYFASELEFYVFDESYQGSPSQVATARSNTVTPQRRL